MTDLPESYWNRESIREERQKKLESLSLSREQLIERVLDLETALYPFVYVLGSLNDKSWRGTMATSKLFPFKSDEDCFQIYKDGKTEDHKTIPEPDLHSVDYFEEDSIIIEDGSQLNDLLNILSVNQQAPGASVGCGSIVMGDIRYAKNVLYPNIDDVVKPTLNTERRSNVVVSSVVFKDKENIRPRTVNMELGWILSRDARKLMNEHGVTNLAFTYDFALDMSGSSDA